MVLLSIAVGLTVSRRTCSQRLLAGEWRKDGAAAAGSACAHSNGPCREFKRTAFVRYGRVPSTLQHRRPCCAWLDGAKVQPRMAGLEPSEPFEAAPAIQRSFLGDILLSQVATLAVERSETQ